MSERSLQSKKTAVAEILKDPELFPDEFKSWLRSYLNNHPDIIWEQSQIPGSIPGSKIKPGSFLSLLTPGTDRKTAFGQAATTYPGASNFSNLMTIPHGLGVVPGDVLALGRVAGDVSFPWTVTAPDATNLYLKMANPFVAPAGGTVAQCWWFAIA